MDEVLPGRRGVALSAAPLLGDWAARHAQRPILLGPDEEAAPWVRHAAHGAGPGARHLRQAAQRRPRGARGPARDGVRGPRGGADRRRRQHRPHAGRHRRGAACTRRRRGGRGGDACAVRRRCAGAAGCVPACAMSGAATAWPMPATPCRWCRCSPRPCAAERELPHARRGKGAPVQVRRRGCRKHPGRPGAVRQPSGSRPCRARSTSNNCAWACSSIST